MQCVILMSLIVAGNGKAFLESSPVKSQDVEASLAVELGSIFSKDRLAEYEAALQPTYKALPKNSNGHIDHQVVRYVLHRFFVQRYGWYINGLEPKGDTFQVNAAGTKDAIQGWVPSFLQDRLEERLGGHGFNLHELSAFAATLEDLVRLEATRRLEEIYEVLKIPTSESVTKENAEDAITTYLMIYLVGRNVSLSNPGQVKKLRELYASKYTGWADVDAWMHTVEKHLINTSTTGALDFPVVSQVVHEMGEQFGSFNNRECQELKTMLMGMEGKKSARVSLPDFYNKSLYSHWKFTEKPEYLRDLGALDESDSTKPPLVILPNYLSSAPNCLRATDLYAVCCPNECEPLLAHLEQRVGKPTASVDQISSLVAALPSPTVNVRSKLPAALLLRLEDIAAPHGGEVNLHGRLFAQWMHHAYPHECPFPHEAGTTNPQTADEWMAANGEDSSTTEDERQKYIADACAANSAEGVASDSNDDAHAEQELPWSSSEELLVKRPQQGSEEVQIPSSSFHVFRGIVFLAALGAAIFVLKQTDVVHVEKEKLNTVLGLCLLAAVAFALDLLDHRVFAFSLVGGLAFIGVRKLSPRHSCLPVAMKEGKCMV